MAYNNNSEDYNNTIYHKTGNAVENKLKITFNGVELENADNYCEEVRKSGRILPNGNKGFYLDNFVSQTVECKFRGIDTSIIQEPISISIGTLVNNIYEYVPLGIYNIVDKPVSDNGRVTIKLIDNSIKFDFKYDGKPLIDSNGGKATLLQILNDICSKAGVNTKITTFDNDTNEIATYDNTITARTYISKLAEQCGGIATIDRDGDLIFVYLNDLDTVQLPLSAISKYDIGDQYGIKRVVYEDGVRKFETEGTGTNKTDTLFISADNTYISSQEQIDSIYDKVKDFDIHSAKIGRCYGNPKIDSYDIIEIVDDTQTPMTTITKTLATNSFKYNGVMENEFTTEIEISDKRENMTLKPSIPNLKKYVNSQIDQVNAQIDINAGQIESTQSQLANLTIKTDGIETKVENNTTDIGTLSSITQQTSQGLQAQITEIRENENKETAELKNELVTIDINGITVSTNTSAIKTLMTNEKFVIKSGNVTLAYFGYDTELGTTKAEMDNLTIDHYLTSGYHRAEKQILDGEKRTVFFFVGGDDYGF